MDPKSDKVELKEAERVADAVELILAKKYDDAKPILLDVIRNAPNPEDYIFQYEADNKLYIKFWNQVLFVHYVTWTKNLKNNYKSIIWIPCAYPKAYFNLGFIYLEEKSPQKALEYLEIGQRFEKTNPSFEIEKAQAHIQLNNLKYALELYNKVCEINEYTTSNNVATALRGKGFIYIEQGELDLAEESYIESQRFDPNSEIAANELKYIAELRNGGSIVAGASTPVFPTEPKCELCSAPIYPKSTAYNMDGRIVYLCTKCKPRL